MEHITRDYVRANPRAVFLFGDNLARKGFGGQAKAMRGEPNAIGVPTKRYPGTRDADYWTDAAYEENTHHIDEALASIPKDAECVVIPDAGLGAGLAELPVRAPRTYRYLVDALLRLADS